jgi:hypothetical protein
MKRMILVVATIIFALTLTVVAFVQERAKPKHADSDRNVPLTLNDARGRPVNIESLAPDDRAQVERIKKAAASLVDEPGKVAGRWQVDINCTYPPLKCSIIISRD